MATEEERGAAAEQVRRIDEAFRRGDLDLLRAAVDDPSLVPNGRMPVAIGSCLTYAIYHSPLAFIRTLLTMGADPNAVAEDGFPPVIAALTCSRGASGRASRADVSDVLRLLLEYGADPDQRGINDGTALHTAVAERNLLAVQILLDAGAHPDLRTRIDECETPEEMAAAAGLIDFAGLLARKGRPRRRRLRSGLTLLLDVPGAGAEMHRQQRYLVRLRLWLGQGEPVRWRNAWGPVGAARLEDDGRVLVTEIRIDRGSLVNGLFYGVDGMRVGGTRRLEMAPHLAYGERGVPGVIPPGATLIAELSVLEACPSNRA